MIFFDKMTKSPNLKKKLGGGEGGSGGRGREWVPVSEFF